MASTRFNNIEVATLAEQLFYIPCNLCNIVLAVSVPCSKLFDVVKVRCGHCTNLWTVNMGVVAGYHHSHPNYTTKDSSSSSLDDQVLKNTSTNSSVDLVSSSRYTPIKPVPLVINDKKTVKHAPEKRKRVPSAYNQFIKQEIQRVKANDPNLSHREAFSAAAKNWAHFPHIQMLEANKHQQKLDEEKIDIHRSSMQESNKRLKSTVESLDI